MKTNDKLFNDLGGQTVAEINARWDKIQIANVFDAMDNMDYPNQAVDLKIRPLVEGQVISGPAVTVLGTRMPFLQEELADNIDFHHRKLLAQAYDGCVIVFDNGGEAYSAKVGEFESRGLRMNGARGVVTDGPVRDTNDIMTIEGFSVWSTGRTPIPSNKRWYYYDFNKPIGLTGTLTSVVRIEPGDWIVGGCDGVVVVPRKIMLAVLAEAEAIEEAEVRFRNALANGSDIEEGFKIWDREN